MKQLEPLIGEWHGDGEIPMDHPMKISEEGRSSASGSSSSSARWPSRRRWPDSISIIGGATEGEPQPMHYFDSRGVKRLYLTAVEGSTWKIWRAPGEDWNGPDGPGFNQRFIGEISADGRTIAGRWERGMRDAADEWETDFPINYVRR
jgi:hypothetical protein